MRKRGGDLAIVLACGGKLAFLLTRGALVTVATGKPAYKAWVKHSR